MNLNSPPSSHFPMHHENDHRDLYHLQDRASSLSCHFFFDPTTQDQTAFYDHRELYQTNHVPDESYNYGGGSTYDEMKNKVDSGAENSNPMKWMSSKMRLIQKMKNNEDDEINNKVQVHQPSSSDLSSNSSSYNTSSPIRVCSDCNTTKTPLWRSGPKGPKSLCNACGIRQRKARRAMAAAAAAASGGGAATSTDQYSPTKIKLQNKGKLGKNGHASQIKKRCRAAASPPSNGQKQLGFEDFLINLSKNLAFQRVFPDDVKDAAILLMALSSGLVNG